MEDAGSAQVLDQDVGRAIVAVDEHARHQSPRALAVDRVVERPAAVVDLCEIKRCDSDLDGAGHRERGIALDADGFAGVEVERGDADVGGLAGHEIAQLLLELIEARRRGRGSGLRDKRRQTKRNNPKTHCPHPRAAALTPESSPNAHIRSKL